MKNSSVVKAAIACLLLGIWCTVSWADSNQIKLVAKSEKETVTIKDGKKEVKLVPAEKVLPGDVVVFTNHYKNTGGKPAEDAVITNPISKHMTYIDGSAFGEGAIITFSFDKGKTFDTPGKLIKTEKGKKRTSRADEYTHVRWTFTAPLPPGKEGDVGFRARLK